MSVTHFDQIGNEVKTYAKQNPTTNVQTPTVGPHLGHFGLYSLVKVWNCKKLGFGSIISQIKGISLVSLCNSQYLCVVHFVQHGPTKNITQSKYKIGIFWMACTCSYLGCGGEWWLSSEVSNSVFGHLQFWFNSVACWLRSAEFLAELVSPAVEQLLQIYLWAAFFSCFFSPFFTL